VGKGFQHFLYLKEKLIMTEEVKDQQSNDKLELESLKKRADQMGLKYHHKVGLVKLKAAVNAALAPQKDEPAPSIPKVKEDVSKPLNAVEAGIRNAKTIPLKTPSNMSPKELASRLVRIRVNCMNPNKTEWEGEIFTVGNKFYGFKKYVPFNNDEGWHVPHMIYEHLKEHKCKIFYNTKDERGNKTREGKLIHEFAVELMDPLTPEEMQELAQRQAMANGTAN